VKVGDLVIHKNAKHKSTLLPKLVVIVSDRSLRGDGSKLWFTTSDVRGWRNANDYEVISESR